MNCQSVSEVVNDLARDRGLDQIEANDRQEALEHLEECAECSLRLRDQRALTRSLQELASEMKSLTTPARVEDRVLASFRQMNQKSEVRGQRAEVEGQRSENRGQKTQNAVRWNRWMLAAAAAVLIALGVAGLRQYVSRQSQPGTADTQNGVAQSSPSALPAQLPAQPAVSDDKPEKQLPQKLAPRKVPRRHSRPLNRDVNASRQVLANAPAVNDTESEIATQFMPLGYAPINPQDGGQLVRVELSRTAMLSMGLPVNMDRYGERVKADVLLGPDGLARAIRFVQ
jgi:hypothetical protein